MNANESDFILFSEHIKSPSAIFLLSDFLSSFWKETHKVQSPQPTAPTVCL